MSASGAKLWRLDFRLPGKKNKQPYSIGAWPTFNCEQARAEAERARKWVAAGLNPTIQRKLGRATNAAAQALDFKTIAEEWYAGKHKAWSAGHADAQHRLLER